MRPYEARWLDDTGVTHYKYKGPKEFYVTDLDGSLTLTFKGAKVCIWLLDDDEGPRVHVKVDE